MRDWHRTGMPPFMRLDPPFILLDDARRGGAPARLYTRPRRVLTAATPAEVPGVLAGIRDGGGAAAGFLSYGAAAAFEPAAGVAPAPPSGQPPAPMAWFGLFDGWDEVADVAALLPDPAGAWTAAPEPEPTRADYQAMFDAAQALIRAGDLYQLNLTFRLRVPFMGEPLALYARLRRAAGAGWGAIVATGTQTLLSLSPELFFALDGDTLTCRPMKGTARRDDDPATDAAIARALATDPKQRAENLMIVDLMRNDLSRVCELGSVAVTRLLEVESYRHVHQLVSTIEGRLASGRGVVDAVAACFPAGSMTGAPKLRAIELLDAWEDRPRGPYAGAFGYLAADGSADLAMTIRTVVIDAEGASVGAGGGITALSDPAAELAEARLKAAALLAALAAAPPPR